MVVQAALTVWMLALRACARTGSAARPLLLARHRRGAVGLHHAAVADRPSAHRHLRRACGAGALSPDAARRHADASGSASALLALIAFCGCDPQRHLAVLLGLLAAVLALALFDRRLVPLIGVGRGAVALALGARMLVACRLCGGGPCSPGRRAGSHSRSAACCNDGIVAALSRRALPGPAASSCATTSAELPDDADVFFWGESVFDRLGRFEGLNEEMARSCSRACAPIRGLQLKGAVAATRASAA